MRRHTVKTAKSEDYLDISVLYHRRSRGRVDVVSVARRFDEVSNDGTARSRAAIYSG